MKTTFKSNEIAHVWAHQSAPQGKCPANMSFDGPTLYSYGTAIARLIEHKGRPAVLINENSFSVTTSGHQAAMRQALPGHLPRFYVSEHRGTRLDNTPAQLFAQAIETATRAAKNAAAARPRQTAVRAQAEAEQGKWLERAREVSDFFGLRKKVDENTIARLAKAKATQEKKEAAARAKAQAARMEENRAKLEAWKAGEPVDLWRISAGDFPVAFRLETEGGEPELVSSLGARVPLHAARVAYRFATSKRGQEWRANGETCPVGNYALDSITPAGIVAGCHRISWPEIERLAPLLS